MASGTRIERRERYQGQEFRGQNPQAMPPRRRRWIWRFGILFVGLGIFAWFLPSIITHTPILGFILQKATGDSKCSVSLRSASLGWLSPIAIDGIAIRDEQNQPMLEVEKLSSDKSLLAILRDYTQLGQFRLEKPVITLVLRSDGSNVEDMLANFKSDTPPEQKSSAKVAATLDILDGTVKIIDQASKQNWQLDKVNVNLNMPSEDAQPMTLKATAEVADPRQPGKLAANLSMKSGQDDKSKDFGDITVQSENLPLAIAQSFVGRYLKSAKLTGQMNCQIHAMWGSEGAQGKTTVQADVDTDQFAFAAEMLGTDNVQLSQLRANGQITLSEKKLDIEKSTLQCDLGNFSITGGLNLDEQAKGSTLDTLSHQQCELNGNLDIARLAAMLPNTLHIRKETQITSGQVQLAFVSRQQANAKGQNVMTWHGQIETGNLVAMNNGRQFAWQKPIAATIDAHDTAQGPVVDLLKCESDFLKIHGSGTPEAFAASLSFNLKELGDKLNQFVDMGKTQIAGDGWGNVNWKRDAEQQFNADAEFQFNNLQVVMPDKQPWHEASLLLYCAAKGKTDGSVNTRLDAASINIKAGEDILKVVLLQPVADLKQGGVWPIRATMQGQLQGWTARVASFLPMDDWRLAGVVDMDIQATGSKEGVNIGQAKIHATQFAMSSPYITLEEPELELKAVGSWNQTLSRLQLAPASLATTSLAVQADNFLMAMPQNGPMEISGLVKYQGDLGRIQQLFADHKKPQAWAMGGNFVGNLQFKQSGNMVRYEAAADVNDLVVADSTGGRFQEKTIKISARGDYETKAKLLKLEQAQVASSFVAAAAAGNYAQSGAEAQADFGGQVNYDLDRICSLMRPYLGPNVRVVGRGNSPLAWRGPLSLDKGRANAALKWEAADIYGFQVGPGEIKPTLAGGMMQIEPMSLDVSQGKVFLAPKIRLSPDPMQLDMPAGHLVQQVQINPRMCAFFLKFIAPVLADVTSAQGAFSIDLDECRIPLSDPAKGTIAGRFIIHSIEIGPGPLIRELATIMGRETPAKLKREGVVPFQMVDGRVYHKDMELIFPDFTVRTYGSVGLDQTLAIMAEMPVPPKWLENNPAAPALRDQIIKIPIAGTLKKPQLDKAEMDKLSRQFIRNAARNMLEEGLNRGLDELFKQK